MMRSAEVELKLRTGNAAGALQWYEALGLSASDNPEVFADKEYFSYIRALIMNNKCHDAYNLLNKLENLTANGKILYRLATVYILKTIALYYMNKKDEAKEYLARAIKLAVPGDFYRQFLDENKIVMELLPEVRYEAPDFIDTLIGYYNDLDLLNRRKKAEACNMPQEKSRFQTIDPLSEREIEILELIAEGLSNQDISSKLFIALGTTKWHINNIYSKLGVKSRTQAVEQARKLNLV